MRDCSANIVMSFCAIQVRLAGDRYVLVEYGPMELDLNLRVRVWALQQYLTDKQARVRPISTEQLALQASV